jgi:hypothetical protein
MRAAELNGPTFAHAIVSTGEIVAALAKQTAFREEQRWSELFDLALEAYGGLERWRDSPKPQPARLSDGWVVSPEWFPGVCARSPLSVWCRL